MAGCTVTAFCSKSKMSECTVQWPVTLQTRTPRAMNSSGCFPQSVGVTKPGSTSGGSERAVRAKSTPTQSLQKPSMISEQNQIRHPAAAAPLWDISYTAASMKLPWATAAQRRTTSIPSTFCLSRVEPSRCHSSPGSQSPKAFVASFTHRQTNSNGHGSKKTHRKRRLGEAPFH